MAEALGVLGEQLGRPGDPEPYKSGRVADFFAQLGTPPQECAVTLDDLGRTHAAVTLPRTRFSAQELAALAGEVGRICRRTLEVPQVLSCKGMTTLLFSEKPVLRAVFGMAGAAARGSISGDAVQQFCSPAAAQMILCDGMGTGRPAAVDGNLAAELTARLLKAGFTAELAARLVNVALALKSEDESGATLDLISVDLYTGTARLFKAGAAPGFLVHGGRVRAVGDTSLPVGILGGVNGQSRVVHLTVGDYAVLAVPYACAAEIRIGPGVYREKLVCEKQDITLIGAGMESTRIVWGDGGSLPHPDGRPTHTFRSYTAFFRGIELRVRDLTIENDAGPGAKVGQAVAAYVDCSHTLFENVRLLGNQDTLFCAPLPEKEREKDGFLGPGRFAPRRPTAQYYRHCEIAGDIDFIFGGADALFEQCTIRTVNNHLPASYVTAPSGRADGLGFVFWDCDFVSDNCPAGTVFLGRPWRPTGKTAVLDCRLGAHIAPEGFSPWQSRTDSDLASFAEAGSTGAGAVPRGAWVKQLDSQQAEELLRCARKLCRPE